MTPSVRQLKINKRYASLPCSWCGDALNIGAEGAICEACESAHHAQCWEQRGGCAQGGCVNAPLPDTEPPGGGRQFKSDEKACPYCEKIIYVEAETCRHCDAIVTADGIYHGEKTSAPDAGLALLYSIAGLLCCVGLVLGPLAFKKGMDAKRAIAVNPRLRGGAMATTAQVLGIFDVVLWLGLLVSNPQLINQLAYWSGFLALPAMGFVLLVLFVRWKINRS